MSNKRYFLYEINVTHSCNFRCSYCFEGDSCLKTTTIHPHINRIKETISLMKNNDWFNEHFMGFQIVFWGGEPTLYPDVLKDVVDTYKDDETVRYHVYTNGSNYEVLDNVFCEIKDRVNIQVSYDGNPIHDMNRVDASGSATSSTVLGCLHRLKSSEYECHIKSSIRLDQLKYLKDAWDDINNINEEYGYDLVYIPSIDYTGRYDKLHHEDLKESLLYICKKEFERRKTHDKYLLKWFEGNITNCSFFSSGMFVDVDGKMKYCHGCGYTDDDSTSFGSIYDEDFIDKISQNEKKFKKDREGDCLDCIAKVCYSCNAYKYINSKKESFSDRWNDHSCQPHLCSYYKIITKYMVALEAAIEKEKANA